MANGTQMKSKTLHFRKEKVLFLIGHFILCYEAVRIIPHGIRFIGIASLEKVIMIINFKDQWSIIFQMVAICISS